MRSIDSLQLRPRRLSTSIQSDSQREFLSPTAFWRNFCRDTVWPKILSPSLPFPTRVCVPVTESNNVKGKWNFLRLQKCLWTGRKSHISGDFDRFNLWRTGAACSGLLCNSSDSARRADVVFIIYKYVQWLRNYQQILSSSNGVKFTFLSDFISYCCMKVLLIDAECIIYKCKYGCKYKL